MGRGYCAPCQKICCREIHVTGAPFLCAHKYYKHDCAIGMVAQGVPAICAIHAASRQNGGGAEGKADSDAVSVVVATAEGILYEYYVHNLQSRPTCALEQECLLLRNAMDS